MATGNNNDWDNNDDDSSQDGNQPPQKKNGLREHAEQVKRENAELQAKLDAFEAADRKRNIEAAIKAKGFDPLVADLVPQEIASDTSKLDEWLTSKEKLFKPAPKQEEADPDVSVDFEEHVLDDDADAFDRISRVSSAALPPSKMADTRSAIKNAKDKEELNTILRKHGNLNVG